jgi:hypothetical protein
MTDLKIPVFLNSCRTFAAVFLIRQIPILNTFLCNKKYYNLAVRHAQQGISYFTEKRKTSETRIKTGARRFSKYVQTDWQSCKIKVGQRGAGEMSPGKRSL